MTHILIIPSEEFIPPESHLAGIFQLHQAQALIEAGFKVGVLSIKQVYSVPMLLKGVVSRLLKTSSNPLLPPGSWKELLLLLYRKLFCPSEFIVFDNINGVFVVRAEGIYDFKPMESLNHMAWSRAGYAAFNAYSEAYGTPDVLHAHNALNGGLLAASLSRKFDLPYVITEHSSFVARGLVSRSLYGKIAACYRKSSSLLVVSPFLGKCLEGEIGIAHSDWDWVPNVLDPDWLRQPLQKDIPKEPLQIIAIGNLISVKDHATVIRAFAKLPKNFEIQLVIAGDGPDENELKRIVSELTIDDQVIFTGRLTRQALIQQIDRSCCVVLPSLFETFGVVLIESLMRGVPVVSSRCGGPECIVNQENGVLVEPQNVAELLDALIDVISNLDRYDAENLRKSAILNFGPQRLVADLNEIYAKALSR